MNQIKPRRSDGTIQHRRVKQPWPPNRPFKILSIDGGGIRGVFPAAYLAELENRFLAGSPITSHFDMVAGTSTGGIIALALGLLHAAAHAGADVCERPLPFLPSLCSKGWSMITDVEDFFTKGCGRCDRFDTSACSTKLWSEGLAKLREICLAADLEEEVRWGQPCYRHAGRNIAILGAYQDKFVLGFFNAALMKDPEGVLEKPGPNTQHADTIYFRETAQVAALEKTISNYLGEAKGYAEEGKLPPKNTSSPDLPVELADALDDDPELAEAFHALTPGRQRSYVINLNGAKKSETRISRIEKFRGKIIDGNGANEY